MMIDELLMNLSNQWFGISILQILQSFVLIFFGMLFRKFGMKALSKIIEAAHRSRFQYDHLFLEGLARPLGWVPILISVYLVTWVLKLPTEPIDLQSFATALFRTSWILLSLWVAIRMFDVVCRFWADVAAKTETKLDDQLVPILRKSGRVVLIIIGVVLVFQNMGYSVGSLLASFGIGGAAIALASKDSLSNLFGSLVIFLDRPFQIGDWIEVEHIEGTVEDVGLRTIRIRTFANSLITVPNAFFTTNVINNWSRMNKRRIKMNLGFTYGTSADQMREAIEGIKGLIRENDAMHHDFFLVNFVGFGPSSLDVMVYCFTKTTNWSEFMATQESFFLDIMQLVEKQGLSFAFPTRTLHVEPVNADPLSENAIKREMST